MISITLAHIDLEVRTSRDEVHLVKIVGPHPHAQQAVHERLHHVGVVIHFPCKATLWLPSGTPANARRSHAARSSAVHSFG